MGAHFAAIVKADEGRKGHFHSALGDWKGSWVEILNVHEFLVWAHF